MRVPTKVSVPVVEVNPKRVGDWERGSTGEREHGSVGVRECGRADVQGNGGRANPEWGVFIPGRQDDHGVCPVASRSSRLSLFMADAPVPLATRNLTRVVDGTAIVADVSIEVAAGAVFVVFGPSGSGKTTLLRLLNRLDEPTRGTVLLDGVDYTTLPPRTVRRRVGLVPQQPALREGTVAENVTWGPRLRDEAVDRDRMAELLDRLGLAGVEDRRAADLSGGEAQRVAIARTLFNDPDIVLLDEPTSSLDAAAADRVETLLADVMALYSLTAVLVTHDADRARRLGTRGVRLEDGRPVRSGRIDEVVRA